MGFNKLSSVKDPLSHRVFPIPRNLSFVNFISLRTIIKDSEGFWRVRIVHRICEFFAFFPQKQNFHKRGHRKQKAKSNFEEPSKQPKWHWKNSWRKIEWTKIYVFIVFDFLKSRNMKQEWSKFPVNFQIAKNNKNIKTNKLI